jgi:acetyl esterase/lipase
VLFRKSLLANTSCSKRNKPLIQIGIRRAGLSVVALAALACGMRDVWAAENAGFTSGIAVASKAQSVAPESLVQREFANAVVRKTFSYQTASPGQPAQTLDIYLPARPTLHRPLIVYVHGGGWSGGHSRVAGAFEDFPEVLARISGQGYVVASVNYRLSAQAIFPAALEDVGTVMRWLQSHEQPFGIDTSRTALWGSSAGGQLATLAALTCNHRQDASTPCAKVLISWFGVYDFPALLDQPGFAAIGEAARQYLGCAKHSCPSAVLDAASPIAHLDHLPASVLLIHGTADRVVPYQQSLAMAQAIQREHGQVALMLLPEVGHSFVGVDPATTQSANYRALHATLRFLTDHL